MESPESKVIRAALIHPGNVAADLMPTRGEEADRLTNERIKTIRARIVAKIIKLIREAQDHGARLICLGELCTAPYFALEERAIWRKFAEDIQDGPSLKQFCEISRERGLVIVAPLYEREERDDEVRYFNQAVVIDKGEIVGRKGKVLIPQGSNEQGSFSEGYYYSPADDPSMNVGMQKVIADGDPLFPSFRTSVGIIGIRICYERHFPQNIQLVREHGVQILLVPAITFGKKSKNLWRAESAAWAGWGNCFAVFLNRTGTETGPWKRQNYFGDSHVMNPEVEEVAPLGASRIPELILVDLDLSMTQQRDVGADSAGWKLGPDTKKLRKRRP